MDYYDVLLGAIKFSQLKPLTFSEKRKIRTHIKICGKQDDCECYRCKEVKEIKERAFPGKNIKFFIDEDDDLNYKLIG